MVTDMKVNVIAACLYLRTDWVTDDLLSKIHDNPVLSEAFTDPALGQVLTQLQSNPQAVAAAAAARDNPKVCIEIT